MRAFLGSLLQSELSIPEIEEIAEEFYFGSFGKEVGEFLRSALNTLGETGRNRAKSLPDDPSTKGIYELINRRRLAKKVVLQLMHLAAPNIRPGHLPANASMLELIEKFLTIATQTEISSFLSTLQGETADAYLKGIARRSKEK